MIDSVIAMKKPWNHQSDYYTSNFPHIYSSCSLPFLLSLQSRMGRSENRGDRRRTEGSTTFASCPLSGESCFLYCLARLCSSTNDAPLEGSKIVVEVVSSLISRPWIASPLLSFFFVIVVGGYVVVIKCKTGLCDVHTLDKIIPTIAHFSVSTRFVTSSVQTGKHERTPTLLFGGFDEQRRTGSIRVGAS